MKKLLTSRKFLATIGALLILVGGALAGEMTWKEIVQPVIAIVLSYLGVEGVADVVSRAKAQ